MVSVRLPDGNVKEFEGSVTPADVAADIGAGLARAAIAAEVDGQQVGLDYSLPADGEVELKLFTKKNSEALGIMRHSAAHVMARAVMRIKKNVKLAFGPVRGDRFYYDFEVDEPITEEDFPAIEKEMKAIIKKNEPFERIEKSRDEAIQVCADLQQELKVEHIETGLADHQQLSFYQQGEFLDLCRGPHIPSAGAIGAFKLLFVAGAYWKDDASNKQLQRLYATAFFDKKDLEDYLERLQEAQKRDHRVLGRKHGLFHIDEMVGQGLILWTPKGAFVRQKLQEFILSHLQRQGYDQVFTPHIGKLDLYRTSGHFPYYQESQYTPVIDRAQIHELATEGCSCGDLANRLDEGPRQVNAELVASLRARL